MRYFTHGRFQQQAGFLRRQFLQDGDLPFTDVLSEDLVTRALTTLTVLWRDRIYTPLVTLWVFLGQVLSADPSCCAAVARLIAHRLIGLLLSVAPDFDRDRFRCLAGIIVVARLCRAVHDAE